MKMLNKISKEAVQLIKENNTWFIVSMATGVIILVCATLKINSYGTSGR